jgi:hypothetical protein
VGGIAFEAERGFKSGLYGLDKPFHFSF